MKKVVLVTCGSNKKPGRHAARNLYIGRYYQACMKYAESLRPDHIFILSAKHHLLDPDHVVSYYDNTLNSMSTKERKDWATKVLGQVREKFGATKIEYTILAGDRYREFLVEELGNVRLPLKGKRLGEALQYLTRKTR